MDSLIEALILEGPLSKDGDEWCKEEDQRLVSLYLTHTAGDLMYVFHRTPGAIRARAAALGLSGVKPLGRKTPFPGDVEFARENMERLGVGGVAMELGRSIYAIQGMCKRNGISTDTRFINSDKDWSQQDTEYVINNYLMMTEGSIARRLRRPISDIRIKVAELRQANALKMPANHGKPWGEEEMVYLASFFKDVLITTESCVEPASKLLRTVESVRYKARVLLGEIEGTKLG